jgi:hypothetical protein
MSGFLGRVRFATLLAVALALLITGVVVGAAGQAMIIGQSNDSGSSQTTLLTTASGASFTLKNSANSQTGQFGWSAGTAGAGRGLYGRADSPAGFGVDAWNNAASGGSGAALRARGAAQVGVLATSDANTAVDATSASGSGVWGTGTGFAAGVVGDGEGSLAGIIGLAATTYAGWGMFASASFEEGIGVYADSSAGTAVIGYGEGALGLETCSSYYCAGGSFSGNNGVLAETNATGGFAVGAIDTGGDGLAIYAGGDVAIDGELFVDACTGCAAASLAVNGSGQAIDQGDAVTLLGVTTAADGSVALVVGPAKKNDAVLGIADGALERSAASVELKQAARTVKARGADGKLVDPKVAASSETAKAQSRKWLAAGARTAPDGYLRVITGGVFAVDAGVSAEVGDTLAVGDKAGALGKAGAETEKGAAAGKFLGKLKDGRSVILVDPS